MYIVVIGLGEVGRHLLSVLDHEGHDVVAVDHSPAAVAYAEEHYDVASLVDPSVGIREDHIGRLRTAVLRPLTDHLTLELSHVWTDRTSNVNSFDYQRHELSLLATYQY